MRKFLKYLGLAIVIGSSVVITWHRFSYPDFTQVRWFIEFWFLWLAWFVCTILGYVLYLFGNGEICPTKHAPDGLESPHKISIDCGCELCEKYFGKNRRR